MTIGNTNSMDNVWKPKIIAGGKDNGILIPNPDWLWELNVGDVFFCKNKKQPSFVLQLFRIAAKIEQNGNRVMRLENPEKDDQYFPVDTRDFSKEFSFHVLVDGVTSGTGDSMEKE